RRLDLDNGVSGPTRSSAPTPWVTRSLGARFRPVPVPGSARWQMFIVTVGVTLDIVQPYDVVERWAQPEERGDAGTLDAPLDGDARGDRPVARCSPGAVGGSLPLRRPRQRRVRAAAHRDDGPTTSPSSWASIRKPAVPRPALRRPGSSAPW